MLTTQAYVVRKAGQPGDVLRLEEDWPLPVPGEGEVLIKVHAVALNPVGYKMFSVWPIYYASKRPGVPELDFAGTVVQAGGGFQPGERVCGSLWQPMQVIPTLTMKSRGALATHLVAPSSFLVRIPPSIPFTDASTLGCAGLVSLWAIHHVAAVTPGSRVFINGGSSGTGLFAIQFAKALGAYVVATGSGEAGARLLKGLGADEVVDYRQVGPLAKYLGETYGGAGKQFDVVHDCIGVSDLYFGCKAFLKPTGIYTDITGSNQISSPLQVAGSALTIARKLLQPRWLGGVPRKYAIVAAPADKHTKLLEEIVAMVEKGEVRAVIDSEFGFGRAEVLSAYEVQMSGRAKGKVVIKVSD